MSASARSPVDHQVPVTVSPAAGPATLRAHRDPRRSATVEVIPPSPSPAVAGEGEGPGERKGFTRAGSPNGLTHGLTSRQAVIGGESGSAFAAYRADLLAALQPEGQPEQDVAETMVMCQWKLRRLWRQESQCYAAIGHRYGNRDLDPGGLFLDDCRHDLALTYLSRHEAHLMRAYLRAESPSRPGMKQAPAAQFCVRSTPCSTFQ